MIPARLFIHKARIMFSIVGFSLLIALCFVIVLSLVLQVYYHESASCWQ